MAELDTNLPEASGLETNHLSIVPQEDQEGNTEVKQAVFMVLDQNSVVESSLWEDIKMVRFKRIDDVGNISTYDYDEKNNKINMNSFNIEETDFDDDDDIETWFNPHAKVRWILQELSELDDVYIPMQSVKKWTETRLVFPDELAQTINLFSDKEEFPKLNAEQRYALKNGFYTWVVIWMQSDWSPIIYSWKYWSVVVKADTFHEWKIPKIWKYIDIWKWKKNKFHITQSYLDVSHENEHNTVTTQGEVYTTAMLQPFKDRLDANVSVTKERTIDDMTPYEIRSKMPTPEETQENVAAMIRDWIIPWVTSSSKDLVQTSDVKEIKNDKESPISQVKWSNNKKQNVSQSLKKLTKKEQIANNNKMEEVYGDRNSKIVDELMNNLDLETHEKWYNFRLDKLTLSYLPDVAPENLTPWTKVFSAYGTPAIVSENQHPDLADWFVSVEYLWEDTNKEWVRRRRNTWAMAANISTLKLWK